MTIKYEKYSCRRLKRSKFLLIGRIRSLERRQEQSLKRLNGWVNFQSWVEWIRKLISFNDNKSVSWFGYLFWGFPFVFLRSLLCGSLTWPDVRIGPKEASKPFGQFPLEQLLIILAKIKIMVFSGFSVAFQLLHSRGEGQKCDFGEISYVMPWITGLGSVLVETAIRSCFDSFSDLVIKISYSSSSVIFSLCRTLNTIF